MERESVRLTIWAIGLAVLFFSSVIAGMATLDDGPAGRAVGAVLAVFGVFAAIAWALALSPWVNRGRRR